MSIISRAGCGLNIRWERIEAVYRESYILAVWTGSVEISNLKNQISKIKNDIIHFL
jgi:hypothetical protein